MYGKIFASLYQGTLRGRAHEILVFTNMIATADRDGTVDKHPKAIAEEVGLTLEQTQQAIQVLEEPDHESRSPESDGRRIVRVSDTRTWGWVIVNHAKYREIRNNEDRREQNRRAQERFRHKKSSLVSHDKPEKANAEAESDAKADTEGSKKPVAASAEVQPPTIEEAISYAQNGASTPIKTEIVEQWHLDRAKVGWMVCKAGDQYPMKDWRSDLRSYAQTWKRVSEERQARTPKQPTRQPGHHRNSCL